MKMLNPNDLGELITVEQCQKIIISDFLHEYRTRLKKIIIASNLEILGIKIELLNSKTCYNGIRIWFKCPICKLRVGVLFQHPTSKIIGCRKCLHLRYKKQRYKGMIEEAV